MRRPGPEMIGTDGASDGDALVYNAETDEYEPAPGGGGGGGGITGLTSADATVDITDNGDGTLDLSTSSGAGSIPTSLVDAKGDLIVGTANDTVARLPIGAAGTIPTADPSQTTGIRWTAPASAYPTGYASDGTVTADVLPSSANPCDDEFNDASGMSGPTNGLAAKWSKHNLATSSWLVLNNSKFPGSLLFDIPTGQVADQAIYQAVPAGDFRISARFNRVDGDSRQMWAIFVVNTSGNGVCLNLDDGSAGPVLRVLTAWQQTATIGAAGFTLQTTYAAGLPVYATLRKSGTTYYGAAWHSNRTLPAGASEGSIVPTAFTPAYIGFGRILGGTGAKIALDWFRVS